MVNINSVMCYGSGEEHLYDSQVRDHIMYLGLNINGYTIMWVHGR